MKIKYPYRPGTGWSFMQWTDIPSSDVEGDVYLRRLRIILTPWFGVYLHFIYEPDNAPHPHDHPWKFWSLVLRGGYTEEVHTHLLKWDWYKDHKKWRAGSFHRFKLEWAHRITELSPGTVTLVFTGRKRRDWGFYTSSGFIPRKEYFKMRKTKGWAVINDPFDAP